jgi:hypothetical protein
MRKSLIGAAVFLIIAVLSFSLTKTVRTQSPSHAAFTAFVVEQRLKAGKEFERENQIHAFKSDGSYARILQRPTPSGQMVNVAWIVDVNSGRSISIHPEIETITTRHLPQQQLDAQFRAVNRSCSQQSGQHQTIQGFDTVRRVMAPSARPGDREEVEERVAPDLDCFPLVQTITQWTADGTEYKTIRMATFVVPGDPAESLFSVPESFVERSPLEAAAEFSRRFPGRTVAGPDTLNRAEQRYQAQQRPQ